MTVIAPERTAAPAARPGYRNDIDGLRTLAILLVVIYHVWLGRVSGGVDVFLMVSAFFLTDSLTRRIVGGEPLRLGTFWAARFRRLLPAAAVTLLGVLATAYLLYPPSSWPRMWEETWASLFYWQNWNLAFSSVDYYARSAAETSPLQHFWSLSVQGQVFVLWPILIGLVALLFSRRREHARTALIVLFALVFAASLAFSIVETTDAQAFAYFDTRTRLWEFAAGSLLALVLPLMRIPALLRAVIGWVGVAGLLTCGVVLDVRGGFPGYLALWPVLSAAAIIVAGTGESTRGGPACLLSSRPLRFFAGDAYALYLVHWPVLLTWMVVADRDQVGILQGAAIIGISLILARLLSRGVERPLQRSTWFQGSPWRGVLVIVLCVGVVAGTVGGWRAAEESRAAQIMADADEGYPGAAQVETPLNITEPGRPLIPVATALDQEWQSVGDPCRGPLAPASEILDGSCLESPFAAEADEVVLVVGDSHVQQLAVPLEEYARERGIGVVTLLKGGCTLGADEEDRGPANPYTCEEWLPAAVEYAISLRPAAVYTVVTRADETEPERLLDGIEETVDLFLDEGIPVLAVRDNPRFDFDMYSCVEAGEDCTIPREDLLAAVNPAVSLDPRATLIDFTPWLCPEELCEGRIGNIALYLDDNHLSYTYARTLTPMLGSILHGRGVLPEVRRPSQLLPERTPSSR